MKTVRVAVTTTMMIGIRGPWEEAAVAGCTAGEFAVSA
jgi:hypothetical protein